MPTLKPRKASQHLIEPRILIRDVIPYEVPERLEDLHGPAEGVLTLPQHVYWGPKADCDLGEPDGVVASYSRREVARRFAAVLDAVSIRKRRDSRDRVAIGALSK